MKVVLLEVSGWGGMCHYTYNLCERLSRLEVKVFQISESGYELDNLPRQFHLEKILRTDQNYFKKWYLIWRFLVREQVDIFHVQSLITARKDFMGFFIMKLLPFKVVYTAHNVLPHDEEERRAFGMKFAFRWIYRLSDFVITHSEQDKNDIMDTFGVSPTRLKTIPHGDYDFFRMVSQESRPSVRKRYKIRDDEKLVLFFGALRRYKGVHKLISALANVGRRELRMKLLIVGRLVNEKYFDELESLIAEKGLSDRVILIGKYVPFEEIGDFFKAADIVALPYQHIYDSGVLRLAFSFAKPVIATRVGIFNQLVAEGKNGFLVDDDTNSIAEVLVQVQQMREDKLQAMGEYSSHTFGEMLSWERIAAKTARIYQNLLGISP